MSFRGSYVVLEDNIGNGRFTQFAHDFDLIKEPSRCLPRTNLGKHNDGITLPQTFPPEPSVAKDTTPQPAFVLTAPQDKDTAQIAEVSCIQDVFCNIITLMVSVVRRRVSTQDACFLSQVSK